MAKRGLSLALLLTGFVLSACFSARTASPEMAPRDLRRDSWSEDWDRYLSRSVPFGFAGGVLVAEGTAIRLQGGYGLADRAGALPVTPETVFYAGSLTKQFTTAAILKLTELGRLSPEDAIIRFLPDLPEEKRAITVHHLLTHTSGLPHDVGDPYGGPPVARDAEIAAILATPLASPPGGKYSYSNAGFVLLAAIVEIASGKPYERFLRDELFVPAGMFHTGYVLPHWERARIAHGYDGETDAGLPIDRSSWAGDGPTWAVRGAGSMLSTLEDLYLWDRALRGQKVLSPASRERLFTKQVQSGEGEWYGYGWVVEERDGQPYIWHNGSDGIFYAVMHRWPSHTLIAWTNQEIGLFHQIDDALSEGVRTGTAPRRFPPETEGAACTADLSTGGEFRTAEGEGFVLLANDDGLYLAPLGQGSLEMLTGGSAPPEVTAANGRASAFLSKVSAHVLAPDAGDNSLPSRMAEAIRGQTGALGTLSGVDVLGTVLSRSGKPTSFARFRFQEGDYGVEVAWNGEEVADASLDTGDVARTRLCRRADGGYAGFNFSFEQPLLVDRPEPDAIDVKTEDGRSLRADRVRP